MDPLSALSVATSVVQFVDFTTSIISGSYQIYKSGSKEIERNAELKEVMRKLVSLNGGLEQSLHIKALTANLSRTDQELMGLCKDCNSVGGELIIVLQKLRMRKHDKWSSVKSALCTIWTQNDIDVLQRRVDGFRQQIALHILVALRNDSAITDDKINQVLVETQRNNRNFLHHSEQLQEWQSNVVKLMHSQHIIRTPNSLKLQSDSVKLDCSL